VREYSSTFGIDREKLRFAKQDAIVMHPGPVNRGVELSHDLTDHRPSVILDQVRNGVAIRMAVLYLLAGRRQEGEPKVGLDGRQQDVEPKAAPESGGQE
jgi:aspartate carbamoyltransferase catalytic subunit